MPCTSEACRKNYREWAAECKVLQAENEMLTRTKAESQDCLKEVSLELFAKGARIAELEGVLDKQSFLDGVDRCKMDARNKELAKALWLGGSINEDELPEMSDGLEDYLITKFTDAKQAAEVRTKLNIPEHTRVVEFNDVIKAFVDGGE